MSWYYEFLIQYSYLHIQLKSKNFHHHLFKLFLSYHYQHIFNYLAQELNFHLLLHY